MGRADVTALVLAGGRATRMGGIDKRALVVEGRSIFERQCEVLAPRVAEIVVSLAPGAAAVEGHRTVTDAIAGVGPLAGIAAGLAAVATPWLLVVAGDMPYISAALVDRMLAAVTDAIDAVGVRVAGMPEPLVCVLRVAPARAAVERRLAAKRYKASTLLTDEGLRVAWLDEVDTHVVRNLNAPQDLPPR
ncbi:MAG: molybdenum cofactor guanylyltransferase [Kofleriaceae bacterium]|nr:molybdenum cofactor guanylyltransferase [Kofleriaceae bacterium]